MNGLFGLYLMKATEQSKQAAQTLDGPATLLMNDAIALAPGIPGLTIGRLHRPEDFSGGRSDYNPALSGLPGQAFERGRQWARRLAPDFGACRATMSVNEPIFTKAEASPEQRRLELKQTAAFEAGWTVEMHKAGKATVIFNLADGNGEPEDLAVLLQEFYYWLKQGPDPGGDIYLGAHVYGASETGWLDDDMSRALYHAYRATELWLPYLAKQRLKCPPIIFTEAGTWGGWRPRRPALDTGQDYLRFADRVWPSPQVEAIILYCHEPLDPEWIPWDIAGTEIVGIAAQWNREHVYRKAIWQEGQGGQVVPELRKFEFTMPYPTRPEQAWSYWAAECFEVKSEGLPSDDPSDLAAFDRMLRASRSIPLQAPIDYAAFGWKAPVGSPSSGTVKARLQYIRLKLMEAVDVLDNLQVNFP